MVEEMWETLIPIDDFIQDYPDNRAPASLKTEIRMFYDERVYIYMLECMMICRIRYSSVYQEEMI